ncbi:hypothetical protein QSV34_12510 [Porticoccus sp. W117]|uniref:hypothetical protein n=1 Tax=Porticoccus sp. W117 TaxID=3054777 RepID=UPI002591625B|nr:hypothetical protein [Porticoccus sp. W117]MDM3872168.1 hypothetical protein [Porticoccus sp. W117]
MMLNLFKSKPLLSTDDTEFQVATYNWLLKNFGGQAFFEGTKLVLPTKEYFPSKVDSEEGAARETFKVVKHYAGMDEWPCKLQAQEEDVDPKVAPTLVIQDVDSGPLGTFQADESEEVVITYNPAIVSNPTQLVATYAHELAHYLTATAQEPPPGGWENWEFATDMAATFLGFGIFMANSAFNFQQYTDVDSQGWQYNRSGYLSEAENIFALAIFLELKSLPIEKVIPYLKPNLKKLLKKAIREVSDAGIISELSAVEFSPVSN